MRPNIHDKRPQENNAPGHKTPNGRDARRVPGNGQLSILLVDDRIDQANNFKRQILSRPRDLRLEVDVVPVGDVADRLREKYYDGGISDLHCPREEDGIKIIEYLKAHNAKGGALLSASEIDKDKLFKIKNDLLPHVNPDFKLESFVRPVRGARSDRLEEWLASLRDPIPHARLQSESMEGATPYYPEKPIDERDASRPIDEVSGYKAEEGDQLSRADIPALEPSGSLPQDNRNTDMHSNVKLFSKLGIAVFAFTLAIYWTTGALIVNPIVSISGIFACCMYWLMAKVDERRSQDS